MVFDKAWKERLRDSLAEIPDYRRQKKGNIRHKLVDIVVITFTAVLCGLKDYDEIEAFGRAREDWFKKFLELPHGIPDAVTFYRVMVHVEPTKLTESLNAWLFKIEIAAGSVINIDGKTICGSIGAKSRGVHIVSAWIQANHITLGQVRTEEHSNEITAIPELLALIDIRGAIVTIDAMGCQKAIAEKIVEGGGNYVLAVKENQPEMYRQITEYFEWINKDKKADKPYDRYTTGYEKDHGRIEKRECVVETEIDWLYGKEGWKNVKSIVKVRFYCTKMEEKREKWKKETVFDRYYVSSLIVSAQEMNTIVRQHWSIENNLHWMLDVAFREDDDKKKTGHAAENMNILRKAALSKIAAHKPKDTKNRSVKHTMLQALLIDDYREEVLFQR